MSTNRLQSPEEKHKARKLLFDRDPAGQDGFDIFATTDMNFRKMALEATPETAEDAWEKLKDREDFKAQLVDANGMPNPAFVTSFEGTPIYPLLREDVVRMVKELYLEKLTGGLILPAQQDVLEELVNATNATPVDPSKIGSKYLIGRVKEVLGKVEKDANDNATDFSEKWMTISENAPTRHGAYDLRSKEDEDESYNPNSRKRTNKSDDEISSTGSFSAASASDVARPRSSKRRRATTGKKKNGDDDAEEMDEA